MTTDGLSAELRAEGRERIGEVEAPKCSSSGKGRRQSTEAVRGGAMGGAACGRWGHRGTSCFQKHNTEEQGAGENCPHHVEWGQLEHVAYRSTREQNMRSLQMPLKIPHCLEVGFALLKVLLRIREMGPASNYSKLGKNVFCHH